MWLWKSINNLAAARDTVARRRYAIIEVRGGLLHALHFRPFPKFASIAEAWLDSRVRSWRRADDHCWLYFNEPRSCPGFLTLAYLVSTSAASLKSIQTALAALDEVAKIKRSDAIVCDASNLRLSDRVMARYGFEKHALTLPGRNFIKRFEHHRKPASFAIPFTGFLDEKRLAMGEILHA